MNLNNDDSGNDQLPEHLRDPLCGSCGVSGTNAVAVTYESAVAGAWPLVARVARAELRRMGLPAHAVEDLLQDAAAVVLRRRPTFSSSDDLAPYVRIVVRRLAYRWMRRQRREVLGSVPDRPHVHSVADLAEHRLRLRGTAEAYAALAPEERRRLRTYLAAESRVGDARERARERKQIERIRVAMSRVADGFAAALGWVRNRFRWLDASPTQASGLAFALTGLMAAALPHLGSAPVPTTAVASNVVYAAPVVAVAEPGQQPAAAAALPSPSAGRTAGNDPPRPAAPSPATRDVVRVTTPTGDDAGLRQRDNPTGNALVCANVEGVARQCVDSVPLPGLGR